MEEGKICGIGISNPDKVLYKSAKVTKLDIVQYYADIAKYMLPFVKNRLLSVKKCHKSACADCFFKKHPQKGSENVNIKKLSGKDYFFITTKKQLIYEAQMGTIEFHIWGCDTSMVPDFMVFDLDPDEKLDLNILRDGVLKLKEVLDELNLKSYLKTSGGKGYHICVRVPNKMSWASFKKFSMNVATLLESKYPKIFTTSIKKSSRQGKIFIDYLRNSKGSTCVAPYSLRARTSPTISMPIAWSDLYNIAPSQVNIFNYKDYLNSSWKGFFKK